MAGQTDNNPILGVQTAYPSGQMVGAAPAAMSQPTPQQPHAIFRWLEWILGIVLVAGGIAAYIFYRKEKI
jgi:hypothetical protein